MKSENYDAKNVIKWYLPLNTNIYLLEFLEIDEALRMSYLSKSFKKSFTALIQKFIKVILNQKHSPKDYLNLFRQIRNMDSLKELRLQLTNSNQNSFDSYLIKYFPINFSLEKLILTASDEQSNTTLIDYFLSNLSCFKNLEYLEVLDLKIGQDGLENFFINSASKLFNLKTLIMRNNKINYYATENIKNLLNFSKLEVVNFSNNRCKEVAEMISENIHSFPNLREFIFSTNSMLESAGTNIILNIIKAKNLNKIDLSGNYLKRIEKTLEKYVSSNTNIKTLNLAENKVDPIASARRVMRMLFSRSGIISNMASNSDVIGKTMSEKNNGAILPQYIYSSPPKLNFSKEELIRILKRENTIRLSNESKRLFDENRHRPIQVHLDLDKQMIKRALYECGYHPDEDDSLKAYHLATTYYINHTDVRNEVVWMKYDKCKIGNFRKGDMPTLDGINLYNLKEERIPLKNIICTDRPNLIVSGSAS